MLAATLITRSARALRSASLHRQRGPLVRWRAAAVSSSATNCAPPLARAVRPSAASGRLALIGRTNTKRNACRLAFRPLPRALHHPRIEHQRSRPKRQCSSAVRRQSQARSLLPKQPCLPYRCAVCSQSSWRGLTLRSTRRATAGFASLRARVNSNVRPHNPTVPHVNIREITSADIPALCQVRPRTRENALTIEELRALGITPESVATALAGSTSGWLCEATAGEVVGFCMADRRTASCSSSRCCLNTKVAESDDDSCNALSVGWRRQVAPELG